MYAQLFLFYEMGRVIPVASVREKRYLSAEPVVLWMLPSTGSL